MGEAGAAEIKEDAAVYRKGSRKRQGYQRYVCLFTRRSQITDFLMKTMENVQILEYSIEELFAIA